LEQDDELVRWHVIVISTYVKEAPWREKKAVLTVLKATNQEHLQNTLSDGKKRLLACVSTKADKETITKALKEYEIASLKMWGPLFQMGDLV